MGAGKCGRRRLRRLPATANTLRAYAADWRAWCAYTAAGAPLLSGNTAALVVFVRWLELREAAPATIERRLTGAIQTLRAYRVAIDPEASRAGR